MHTLLLILGLAATAGMVNAAPVTPPVQNQNLPNANDVYFSSVNYAGSGCPISPPSAVVTFAPDKTSFTVLFDQFVARTGPGVSYSEQRKNCQLTISVHVPGGWQYSIASADFRGYANLEDGVTGRQQSIYYFQGDQYTTVTQALIKGPTQDNYSFRDQIVLTSTSWSPCGEERPLNINTAILVNSRKKGASGELTTDSVDGKVVQEYQFQWKKCRSPLASAEAVPDPDAGI
ncbi:uncharacterized protein EV422DRAFT_542162 [Fimicolochytrium jonesii]|uniref:uncharacterized protein n=1 Tax=Fimicolochytrium jonesii TaxID=1396493 RepID=UPI0022FF0F49|nr:uncharacterized protein EV422DRAFT_542162 [Fimicolochytrium jonesii]KAI8817264.1 hypothetical protein EV422DRAFT_542162 [Fimicolochytrium jonesii]